MNTAVKPAQIPNGLEPLAGGAFMAGGLALIDAITKTTGPAVEVFGAEIGNPFVPFYALAALLTAAGVGRDVLSSRSSQP